MAASCASDNDDGAIKPFDTYKYVPPTKERILSEALSPGMFSAKCRKCGEVVRGNTVKELHKHKCLIR